MTEANKFSPGDVVELKSGGPLMTVVETLATGKHVKCVWFIDNLPNENVFYSVSLKQVQQQY